MRNFFGHLIITSEIRKMEKYTQSCFPNLDSGNSLLQITSQCNTEETHAHSGISRKRNIQCGGALQRITQLHVNSQNGDHKYLKVRTFFFSHDFP